MNWGDFKQSDPELAALGEERFEHTGLVMLGTLRKNGWPRISPVEFLFFDGKIYLGMMWQSMKALDLLRDPRCTVHSTVSDKEGSEGEFKLYGRAIDITDPEERARFGKALYEKMGWDPNEPEDPNDPDSQYHLFAIDIESASYAKITDGKWERRLWNSADS